MTDAARAPVRAPITSGVVWHANDVGPPDSWTYELDEPTRDAIVAAVDSMRAHGVNVESASRPDLALPELAPLIAPWISELNDGRGFVLVRGFPVDRLDAEAVELAYSRARPAARTAREPRRRGHTARPRPRCRRTAHDPGDPSLCDERTPGLPHGRR